MTWSRSRRITGWVFILPYLVSFCLFVVTPIVVSLFLAFQRYDLTSQSTAQFIGFQNFQDAFKDEYFWKAMRATLWFAALMVPSLGVIALAMALGMNAMAKGRNVVRAVLFVPAMFNVAVAGILWQWFYNGEFGLLNFALRKMGMPPQPFLSNRDLAMPSIVVMSLWWSVGGASVVLLAGLQQIPKSMFEAAELDGAKPLAMLSKVTLPLLKPVLLFVILTNSIGAFQVFGQPFLLTRGGPELATRGVVQYIYETAFNNYRMGYGAAMSWLLFLVIAVFSIAQYRFMRSSAQ